MKRAFRLSLILLSLASVFACTDFHEENAPAGLEIDKKEITFHHGIDNQSFNVQSGTKWYISSKPDWISASSISRLSSYAWSVTFASEKNAGYDRNGQITVTTGVQSETIDVTQVGEKGKYVAVQSISISANELTLTKGESSSLTYTISPSNASIKDVTWESDNASIATVSSAGEVKAVNVGTATITVTTFDGGKTAICAVTVNPQESIPEAVDLGLPSRLKWASFNVGASAPEEYGDCFAWGEIEPKDAYSWSNYVLCNGNSDALTKYNTDSSYGTVDNKTVLEAEDDVARANWGGKWRIPSFDECMELRDNCSWTWTDNYNGTGVAGMIVTSIIEGYSDKSIFLPTAGRRFGTAHADVGSRGYFWSSSLNTNPGSTVGAWYFYFGSSIVDGGSEYRNFGFSVRPVLDDRIHPEAVTLNKTSLSLNIGSSVQLTATVLPSNATNKSVTWSSSDASFATVSSDGLVTAKAAGRATITVSTVDGGKSATCSVIVGSGPEAVDLGLPSGLKWASCNVGASAPEEYGDCFAWGETEPKSIYDWSTYKWCNGSETTLTKYNTNSDYGAVDNKTVLDAADDAARANWGGKWRMPTYEEWTELRSKCTWTWTTRNGVNGMLVTGKNGNSIFLPAAGFWNNTIRSFAGRYGDYWSSSIYSGSPSTAWYAGISGEGRGYGRNDRFRGYSVRPVTE